MTDYVCNFYRASHFGDDIVRATLGALTGLRTEFFPLTLWQSSHNKVVLQAPMDYRRALVPAEYTFDGGAARIPFEAANGADVVFTESNEPMFMLPSLDIEFNEKKGDVSVWSTADWFKLFKAVVAAFSPEYGRLADMEELTRPAHDDIRINIDTSQVPVAIHWINYFGPQWARRIGVDRLGRVRGEVAAFESLPNGGVLLALLAEPFLESNPGHVAAQGAIEAALDLKKLQKKHPAVRL